MRSAASYALAILLFIASTLVHGQSCVFNSTPAAITFAALDPSVATTQTASTTVKVRCTPMTFMPTTWQFSGTNGSAPLQMKHVTQNAFIPYTVAPTFINRAGMNQNWRITATVLGTDYQNGYVGKYSDLLTVTILP